MTPVKIVDILGDFNNDSSERNENTNVNSAKTEKTNHPVRNTEISYPRNAKKNIKSKSELTAAKITIVRKNVLGLS